MTECLIIGYGNLLCGDDGIGCVVADLLAKQARHPGVKVVTAHQLYPEMALDLAEANCVIFIDASVEEEAGQMRITQIEARQNTKATLHHLSPQELLGFTQSLIEKSPQAFLVSIGGENFELGLPLSESVAAQIPDFCRQILEIIRPDDTFAQIQISTDHTP